MNKAQKQYKALIKADLKIASEINIPAYIRNKADQITGWEAECRYYPVKIVRKDSIKRVCDEVKLWLDQGKTR